MQPQIKAQSAYSNSHHSTKTDKGLELDAFANATRKLSIALTAAQNDYPSFVSALHENRRLWIHMGAAVADPGNQLSSELRARIFFLAQFVDQHTAKVLGKAADPSILLEINSGIMRGLSSGTVSQ